MDVGLLLLCTLADQQEERREMLLRVKGIAAVDGFVGVALQLVLEEGKAKRTFGGVAQGSDTPRIRRHVSSPGSGRL